MEQNTFHASIYIGSYFKPFNIFYIDYTISQNSTLKTLCPDLDHNLYTYKTTKSSFSIVLPSRLELFNKN